MAEANDLLAEGRVLAVNADSVVFAPGESTYELLLKTPGRYEGPVNEPIRCRVRVTARKVYSVPSGGSFIVPIVGPPRIVQGRVKYLDETEMVLHASAPVIVRLPEDDAAYDLACGPLSAGRLVNVAILPGASFEPVA